MHSPAPRSRAPAGSSGAAPHGALRRPRGSGAPPRRPLPRPHSAVTGGPRARPNPAESGRTRGPPRPPHPPTHRRLPRLDLPPRPAAAISRELAASSRDASGPRRRTDGTRRAAPPRSPGATVRPAAAARKDALNADFQELSPAAHPYGFYFLPRHAKRQPAALLGLPGQRFHASGPVRRQNGRFWGS